MARNTTSSPGPGGDTRTAEEIAAAAAREAAEKEAAEKAEAERLAAEKAEAERVEAERRAAAEKAEAERLEAEKKNARKDADGPALVVFAKRAMFRAGRAWNEGSNELTDKEARELGEEKLKLIAADPNFSLGAAGGHMVAVGNLAGKPVTAHTVVLAKRAMFRGGRAWNEGANPLDEEQVAELGDKLDQVKADPNFTVIQPKAAA